MYTLCCVMLSRKLTCVVTLHKNSCAISVYKLLCQISSYSIMQAKIQCVGIFSWLLPGELPSVLYLFIWITKCENLNTKLLKTYSVPSIRGNHIYITIKVCNDYLFFSDKSDCTNYYTATVQYCVSTFTFVCTFTFTFQYSIFWSRWNRFN